MAFDRGGLRRGHEASRYRPTLRGVRWWNRKRIMLLTGASGFLGRHLVEASEQGAWELLAPSSQVLDVRSRARVADEVGEWKPNVVVHLAYRRDDRRVIVDGSRHVATAAAAAGARLIHLSTDLVFAGREAPYTEADRPDATVDYGRWKAEAEGEVLRAHPGALVIRTSLLYGTEHLGTPQRDVQEVMSGRSTMRFFTDELRCPAHAADVAAAIVVLADRPDVTGVLHVAGPQAVSRAEFARAIAAWLGFDPARVPTTSLAESGQSRPGRVLLDSSRAASLGLRCRSVADALAR